LNPDLLKQLNLWHQKDQYNRIIATIEEIPEAERDYELVCQLGRALNNEDRYEEAIAAFRSVEEQGATDSLWYYRLGYAYYYSKKYKDAVAVLEQAVKLQPGDSDCQRLLNWSSSKLKESDQRENLADQTTAVWAEEDELAPFTLVSHDNGSVSLILSVGGYKNDIFEARAEEGFEGNGYDWASLAAVFLEEKMPELAATIHFDPEAGMFAAYTSDKEAMASFAKGFKQACENDALIRDLFSRAELD
jgi:tetratricopeptide (TPR) repeat protein